MAVLVIGYLVLVLVLGLVIGVDAMFSEGGVYFWRYDGWVGVRWLLAIRVVGSEKQVPRGKGEKDGICLMVELCVFFGDVMGCLMVEGEMGVGRRMNRGSAYIILYSPSQKKREKKGAVAHEEETPRAQ